MDKMIESLAPVSTPMWAAFYDDEEDSIYFKPIIAIALVSEDWGSDREQSIVPIWFWRQPLVMDEDQWEEIFKTSAFIGYTLHTDAFRARDECAYGIAQWIKKLEEIEKDAEVRKVP